MSFSRRNSVAFAVVTLFTLGILTFSWLERGNSGAEGELIVYHNESLDAYSRHLLTATNFTAPGLEGKDDLVKLVVEGDRGKVFAKCNVILEEENRGLCFINVGEALFISQPNQLSESIKFCESFRNTYKIELNRSPAVVCVAGLIQHYLNEYGTFHEGNKVDLGVFEAYGNFCLTLEHGSKRACVQELSLFTSAKGFLVGSKESYFELCEIFINKDLNAVCGVGMGRSFITDKYGKVGVIDSKVLANCLAIDSEKYRVRCLTVIGSMDPTTKLEDIVKLCEKNLSKAYIFCSFYVGVMEYGRAHGVLEDGLRDCTLISDSRFSRACRIGVMMAQISLNFQKIEYLSMQMFIKRENIAIEKATVKDERDMVLAALLTAEREDLTLIKDDIFVIRKICSRFLESCEEAVGVVYKNFKIEKSELLQFCESRSCRRGYDEGLS